MDKEPCYRCGRLIKPLTDKVRVNDIQLRQVNPEDSSEWGPPGTRRHRCESPKSKHHRAPDGGVCLRVDTEMVLNDAGVMVGYRCKGCQRPWAVKQPQSEESPPMRIDSVVHRKGSITIKGSGLQRLVAALAGK